MKLTCQSEYGALQSVFIKKSEDAFIDQRTIGSQWKELNFLSSRQTSPGFGVKHI